MSLYQPSKLLALLKSLDKLPKKSLSQNFLIDGNILKKIIQAAQIQEGDLVLEIGPGPGSLTLTLLDAKAQVIAVEKDTVFAQYLNKKKNDQNLDNLLEVLEEDFLKTDLKKLAAQFKNPKKAKIKVVANLPYNITTPILIKLLRQHSLFSSLTLMMQKEVAERIIGSPKTKAYGSLTLFIKTYADPKIAFKVSANSFYPPPTVQSAVVVFQLKKPLLKEQELEGWHQFVQRSFQQRRKKLTSSLQAFFEKETIEKALADLNLNPNSRPEELDFEKFLELFKKLKNKSKKLPLKRG